MTPEKFYRHWKNLAKYVDSFIFNNAQIKTENPQNFVLEEQKKNRDLKSYS